MANTSRTIKVIFDGSVAGLITASAAAKRAIKSIDDQHSVFQRNLAKSEGLQSFSTKFLRMGALIGAGSATMSSAASTILTIGHAIAVITPGLLALPGIVLGGAAAFGVFKLATDNVAKALGGSDKAMKALTPSAREAVQTILSFKGGFDGLKASLQEGLFTGLATEIKETASTLLPLLQSKLGAIATGFNGIAVAGLQAARTPFFTNALGTILDKTGVAVQNMKNSLANAATGLVGLGTVGAQYLPAIGTAIDNVAAKFNAWVKEGLQSGHIKQLVDDAIAALKQLGGIAENVGGILKAVFSGLALGGANGSLEVIKQTTQAIKDFLNTAQAQEALKTLGQTITVVGGAFKDVLLTALQQLTPVIIAAGPFIQELARTIGSALVAALQAAGPLLTQIATFLSQNKDIAAPLAAIIIGLGAAFKVFAVVAPIVSGIAGAFSAVGSAISGVIGFFAGIADAVAAVIGVLGGFSGILAAVGEGIAAVFGAIGAVISAPITLIVAAIALIGGALVLAYNKIQVFHDAVDTAFGNIKTVITGVITFFSDIPDAIGTAFSAIGDFFTSLPAKIGAVVTSIGDFFSSLPAKAGEVVAAIGNFFAQLPFRIGFIIGSLIGATISGFQQLFSAVGGIVSAGIAAVVSFFQQLPARAIAAVQALISGISSFFTSVWNTAKTLTTSGIAAVISFFQQLPSKAIAAVTSLISSIGTFFVNVFNSAKTAVTNGITAVVNFFKELPGKVVSALGDLGKLLVNAGKSIIDGLLSGIKSAVGAVYDFVSGIGAGIQARKGPLPVDRKLLTPAGVAIMQSLLNGLKTASADVYAWVNGVANSIQGALSAQISPSLSLTGTGPALSVLHNIATPAQQTQAEQMADAVSQAVHAALSSQNFSIKAVADEDGFMRFIKFMLDDKDNEVARRVSAGRGISFAS